MYEGVITNHRGYFPVYPVSLWYNLFVVKATAGFDRKIWCQKPVLTGKIWFRLAYSTIQIHTVPIFPLSTISAVLLCTCVQQIAVALQIHSCYPG